MHGQALSNNFSTSEIELVSRAEVIQDMRNIGFDAYILDRLEAVEAQTATSVK